MPSIYPDPTTATGQPAQQMDKLDLKSKDCRDNWFHGLGSPQRCRVPRGAIDIVAKTFGVSHDIMLNYLSQLEVMEYFVGGKDHLSFQSSS